MSKSRAVKFSFHRIIIGLTTFVVTSSFAQADDIANGEKVFKQCMRCHAIKTSAVKGGPTLKGILGRPVASVEDYEYSKDLLKIRADGKIWNDTLLDEFLINPKAMAPAGYMTFPGLERPEDRADLIAYLKTKM